jgi:hypothetical protein
MILTDAKARMVMISPSPGTEVTATFAHRTGALTLYYRYLISIRITYSLSDDSERPSVIKQRLTNGFMIDGNIHPRMVVSAELCDGRAYGMTWREGCVTQEIERAALKRERRVHVGAAYRTGLKHPLYYISVWWDISEVLSRSWTTYYGL